ncbi:MAG: hypothetical protein AB1700_03180 [Bacillota bacterium]
MKLTKIHTSANVTGIGLVRDVTFFYEDAAFLMMSSCLKGEDVERSSKPVGGQERPMPHCNLPRQIVQKIICYELI